jgi:TolA-binding protein
VFVLAALSLGGCASVQDVTGLATQQDLQHVRSELTIAEQNALRARRDVEAASADAQKRDAERDRRFAALTERLDGLTAALSALNARLDDVSGRLETLSRQMRATTPPAAGTAAPPPTATPLATAAPLPTARPAPAGTTPPPAPVVSAPPPAGPVAAPPGNRPTTNALQPQDIYQSAYLDYSKGSYALAIAGFREFLRRYPEHALAGAAQYWVGEAHFSLARGHVNAGQTERANEALEQAVQEFRKVLASYPRSDKAPTALYKEALALFDLKQPAVAQARLQYLVDTFPQSEESVLARERLATLKR